VTAGLPEGLRQATRALHKEVECSDFMRTLLRGEMRQDTYCLLLRNLHALYEALERALLEQVVNPLVAAICMPALFRTDALALDLRALYGAAWRSDLAIQPACRAYVQHLHQIARAQPELLVAHAYVRYLGDLSGGQQLQRIVARSLSLVSGHGAAFYHFGNREQTADLTRDFRAVLGSLSTDNGQHDQIVAEAQSAFVRHAELFRQLAVASGLLQADAPLTSP
jgi:heme oxygenase